MAQTSLLQRDLQKRQSSYRYLHQLFHNATVKIDGKLARNGFH